ncbi:cation diffusion facilitator family transporter [Fictibacillus sp. KU28468]|uniref:cation diffusion facilitator family transporter n=1 Tax=Fictibacillus sp. KU28468 TaxID=2991053 RepID=UPI00223E7372|nr:cation diffusion facilitator family transporter [Fictibacillus sp. KU28468]UZJ81021.1 cation diffusion facilitator family transporter [Fictibacillus sp. KU28468]
MVHERERIGKKVAWLAVISNCILTIGKVAVGLNAGSESVFADGIHSAADIVASIAVLAVVGISNKPPDEDHPFGHGKAEVLSEGFVGIILFLVSIYIVVEGILGLIGTPKAPEYIALFAALFSYIAKHLLYHNSMKLGEKYNSKAIIAIAFDHKADIVASLAAFFGVILSIIGDKFNLPYLLYGDAAASLIVAFLILKISLKLLGSSVDVLMDKNIEKPLLTQYRKVVMEFKEVKRIDRMRARTHGHYIILDLRISLNYDLSIKEGHDIARNLRDEIQKRFPDISEVFIHINPYFPDKN